MKITSLYVYPIKALRGIPLTSAWLTAQGIRHDRRFMLFEIQDGGELKKMQIDSIPECGLFSQEFDADTDATAVIVRYRKPTDPITPPHPLQQTALTVSLTPDITTLERVDVVLHKSPASAAYRMGAECNEWFSACFGRNVVLVYLGDGHREIIGETLIPLDRRTANAAPSGSQQGTPQPAAQSWTEWAVGGLTSTLSGFRPAAAQPQRPRIGFSDVAPFLMVHRASVQEVSSRLSEGIRMDERKFRPNIVVGSEGNDEQEQKAWAEDFWGEVEIAGTHRLVLTANCLRCSSLNVDYETGKVAQGELGTVLKKLMSDRRVDKGSKWNPVFGRYAFLVDDEKEINVKVGDSLQVTKLLEERTVFDWP